MKGKKAWVIIFRGSLISFQTVFIDTRLSKWAYFLIELLLSSHWFNSIVFSSIKHLDIARCPPHEEQHLLAAGTYLNLVLNFLCLLVHIKPSTSCSILHNCEIWYNIIVDNTCSHTSTGGDNNYNLYATIYLLQTIVSHILKLYSGFLARNRV